MGQIINLKQIISIIDKLKKDKKTIVLATGVFDLLHRAHRQFLLEAKYQGDYLIVGAESDERVKKIKGKDRPIETEGIRIEKIAKLPFTDYVFILPKKFDTIKEQEYLIAQLKPDILAVSSHSPYLQKKKEIIEKHGGELKIVLEEDKTISTTKLLKK